jgi:Tat protein secretion system quality control protein TatD with DNase activity
MPSAWRRISVFSLVVQLRTDNGTFLRLATSRATAGRFQVLMGKTKGLPAIIHCKDTGDGAAAARALELITQLGCRVMRFHRHCFNGDLLELQQWHALPNTVFGVTWKSVRESPDFIPRINLDQLVLETDSPYLSLYSS